MIRAAGSLFLSLLLMTLALQQKSCDKKPATAGGGSTGSAPSASVGTASVSGADIDVNAAEREIRRKIEDLRGAFESKMARSVTREMDPNETSAYAGFEEQIQSLMDNTTDLQLFLRPANIQVRPAEQGRPPRAQAQVDAEMRYSLKSSSAQQKQKRQQLLMDFVKSPQGWRIARIEPRSFFTP